MVHPCSCLLYQEVVTLERLRLGDCPFFLFVRASVSTLLRKAESQLPTRSVVILGEDMLFPPVTAKYKGERVRITSVLNSERKYISVSDIRGQVISGVHAKDLSSTKIHDNLWEVWEFLTRAEQRLKRPVCPQCKSDFPLHKRSPKNRKYCGAICKGRAKRAKEKLLNPPVPKNLPNCLCCGAEIPDNLTHRQLYCTRSCQRRLRKALEMQQR